MEDFKPIETIYKGYRFRSRLEARWAVFFDTIGAKWEYEPEGFDLGNGIWYLPDFLVQNVSVLCPEDDYCPLWGNRNSSHDVYFEVKGKMTEEDSEKIKQFGKFKMILPIGHIPEGDTIDDICDSVSNQYYEAVMVNVDNQLKGIKSEIFEVFQGYYLGVDVCDLVPCLLLSGTVGLLDPIVYPEGLKWVNAERTVEGYRRARQARFEHGEHGYTNNYN